MTFRPALDGTRIAAVAYNVQTLTLAQVYCQSNDLTLRQHFWDGHKWVDGEYLVFFHALRLNRRSITLECGRRQLCARSRPCLHPYRDAGMGYQRQRHSASALEEHGPEVHTGSIFHPVTRMGV